MYTECKYDPKRDLEEVVPALSVDIADCVESGVVFDTGTLTDFNDIEDPSSIWRRVRSAIDAAELHRQLSKSFSSVSSSASVSSEPAAAAE